MAPNPIKRAIAVCGGQTALAKAINVTPPLVWQWLHGRRPVSGRHCIPIERVTEGAVTRGQLRPDIFGKEHNNNDG